MDDAKPFDISKREVWEAYKRVRANQGAAGVDEQSIAEFEEDLANNLYKLWNRLASGSYFGSPSKIVAQAVQSWHVGGMWTPNKLERWESYWGNNLRTL